MARKSLWGVSAVILDSGAAARRIAGHIKNPASGIRIKGILTEDHQLGWSEDLPPVLGRLAAAPELAKKGLAHYAILAMPHRSNSEIRQVIQDYCAGFRHVLLIHDLTGLCSLGVTAREICGEIGLEVPQRLFQPAAAFIKRSLDIVLAAVALLLILPLFLLIALLVKLTSKGPVFFGHARYGRDGNIFKALKFRTMVQNADEVLLEYLRNHPDQFAEWQRDHKLKSDPRITSVGKWLRRLSLDELPQLLNVLLGQMSLVGPRPIVKTEIPKYGSGYDLYIRVRPGITGLWQVSGRNNTTYQERVAFDEYYVRNWSVWLDFYLLIRTVRAVLTADGAY